MASFSMIYVFLSLPLPMPNQSPVPFSVTWGQVLALRKNKPKLSHGWRAVRERERSGGGAPEGLGRRR